MPELNIEWLEGKRGPLLLLSPEDRERLQRAIEAAEKDAAEKGYVDGEPVPAEALPSVNFALAVEDQLQRDDQLREDYAADIQTLTLEFVGPTQRQKVAILSARRREMAQAGDADQWSVQEINLLTVELCREQIPTEPVTTGLHPRLQEAIGHLLMTWAFPDFTEEALFFTPRSEPRPSSENASAKPSGHGTKRSGSGLSSAPLPLA